MAINDLTLRKDVFSTIYSAIDLASSTYTPSNSTVLGGYPDIRTISLPTIAVMPINVSSGNYTIDTSRSVSTKGIPVVVHLFAVKSADIDSLSDGVCNTLSGNISGLCLIDIQEDWGFVMPNDNKLKQKTITFNFVRR